MEGGATQNKNSDPHGRQVRALGRGKEGGLVLGKAGVKSDRTHLFRLRCCSKLLQQLCCLTPQQPHRDRAVIQALAVPLLTPALHHHSAPEKGEVPVRKRPTKVPGKEVLTAFIQCSLQVQVTLVGCGCSGDVCHGDSRRPHPVWKNWMVCQ